MNRGNFEIGFNIEIDHSKVQEMPDGSVIVGDEGGVCLNGDFLLELLTKRKTTENNAEEKSVESCKNLLQNRGMKD